MPCSSARPSCLCGSTIIASNKPGPVSGERMSFMSKRVREISLVVLVGLAATLANLPEETIERFDIDRDLLLGSLALVVFIALFLYLKFQFFFLVVLLALAANMPGEVAESLAISKLPLIIAMATMVGLAMISGSFEIAKLSATSQIGRAHV